MGTKQKEVEKWITVNGVHIPVFKGQTVEEAVKKVTGKKDGGSNKQPSEQEMRDFIKSKGHEKFVKELSGETEKGYKQALQYVYDQDTLTKDQFAEKYGLKENKQISKDQDLKEKQIKDNEQQAKEAAEKTVSLDKGKITYSGFTKKEESELSNYDKQIEEIGKKIRSTQSREEELKLLKEWDNLRWQRLEALDKARKKRK